MLSSGNAMLVDFGLATPIVPTDTSPAGRAYEHLGLTKHYAAPERFSQLPGPDQQRESIGTKADVFSFGLLLLFMWTGKVRSCCAAQAHVLARLAGAIVDVQCCMHMCTIFA